MRALTPRLCSSIPGDYGFDPLELGAVPASLAVSSHPSAVCGRARRNSLPPPPLLPPIWNHHCSACALFVTMLRQRRSLARFSLPSQRFREAELIHGRWAMLGAAGVIAVEALGYGDWVSAQTADPQTYFGQVMPFDIKTVREPPARHTHTHAS